MSLKPSLKEEKKILPRGKNAAFSLYSLKHNVCNNVSMLVCASVIHRNKRCRGLKTGTPAGPSVPAS